MQKTKKVAIIGAGASGLPAIKVCLEDGFEPVCFEKSGDIGGLWRYKPGECDGEASVMKSTVINSSKEMTAYSDFPPPPDFANYMHNTKMLEYFQRYADHFQLKPYIRFHHSVLDVSRAPDFNTTGRWVVTFKDQSGVEKQETFDGVLLASGHHVDPYSPKPWPGQESYTGSVLHSHSFKDHRGYEDKRVVVVGVGNSGGDIAVELSRIAAQVYLVTRRGTWVVNRIFDKGLPVDLQTTRFTQAAKNLLPDALTNYILESKLEQRFDHAKYGLKPAHRVFGAHVTVNDELPNRIACGTIIVKPNIARFTTNGVVFEDGTSVENIDAVIMSTGYSFSFPYAEGGKLISVDENRVRLYKFMYPPQLAGKNTLAVLGLIQPLGSIMPISELQARVFCQVLAGSAELPDERGMNADVDMTLTKMAKRFVASRRHTIQVDYVPYMDELASLIGAYPDLKALALSDPLLALKVVFGPTVPYQYRLNGPHTWNGAREAIMQCSERVDAATRTRRTEHVEATTSFMLMLYIFIAVIIAYYLLF
uniref:Flavin-containing monooxygenase n=1 Tax=Plectus sambesii TaxID=2011161 RepID=A0A914WW04_9BILA